MFDRCLSAATRGPAQGCATRRPIASRAHSRACSNKTRIAKKAIRSRATASFTRRGLTAKHEQALGLVPASVFVRVPHSTFIFFFGLQVDHARLPKLEQEHKLVLSRAKLLESKTLTLEDANKNLHESTVKQQHELAQLALQLQESAHQAEIQASQSQRNLDLELQKCRQSVSAELHEAQNARVSLVAFTPTCGHAYACCVCVPRDHTNATYSCPHRIYVFAWRQSPRVSSVSSYENSIRNMMKNCATAQVESMI